MKFIFSMVLIASVGVAVQAMPSAVQSQMQSTMEKFMAQANLDSTNPDLPAHCNALYSPIFNKIAAGFQNEYDVCMMNTEQPSTCVYEARVDYRTKLDAANKDLKNCLNGGVAASTTTAQTQSTITVTTEGLDSTNPDLSAQCNALYDPMFNNIATGFQNEYDVCMMNTEQPSTCVYKARVDYRTKLDEANKDLKNCLNGGVAASTTTYRN